MEAEEHHRMMRPTSCRLPIFCALTVASLLSGITAGDSEPRFPGAQWETRTPQELGLDGAKLDAMAALLGGKGCVVFDGFMVKTWGSVTTPMEWASAGKPVLGTLLLFAVKEGRLASTDDRILDAGWPLIDEDHPMTYRNLSNMVSGYMRVEPPASAWSYNDYGIQLLVDTLFDRVFEASPNQAASDSSRLGALGFEDGGVFSGPNPNRVHLSIRDFARIAWLWLNEGQWNGEALLPREAFTQHRRPQVAADVPVTSAEDTMGDYLGVGTYGGGTDQTPYGPGIYGFGWWFNGFGPGHAEARTWPDAPADAFQANGNWGLRVATMIPSHNVVLLHQESDAGFAPGEASSKQNQALKLLMEALRPRPLLQIGKEAGQLALSWSADCAAEHAIYEGQLGDWGNHAPVVCNDAGSDRIERLPAAGGNRYYLIVPRNAAVEGSYGRSSSGEQRPASETPCVAAHDVGFCP